MNKLRSRRLRLRRRRRSPFLQNFFKCLVLSHLARLACLALPCPALDAAPSAAGVRSGARKARGTCLLLIGRPSPTLVPWTLPNDAGVPIGEDAPLKIRSISPLIPRGDQSPEQSTIFLFKVVQVWSPLRYSSEKILQNSDKMAALDKKIVHVSHQRPGTRSIVVEHSSKNRERHGKISYMNRGCAHRARNSRDRENANN